MGGCGGAERGAAGRAVRRTGDRPYETGRGHRGQQHPGHHARRPADHRAGPRRRRADLRRRRARHPAHPGRHGRPRADFYATSAYKWSGPHIGAVIARPELLERLSPASSPPRRRRCRTGSKRALCPSPTWRGWPPRSTIWPGWTRMATGTRRERLLASMAAVEAHEQAELAHLLKGLSALSGVGLVGSPSGVRPPRSSPSPGTPPPGGRASGRPPRSTCGTGTATPGSSPRPSASATPDPAYGPGWCTTTTDRTWTACSTPWQT